MLVNIKTVIKLVDGIFYIGNKNRKNLNKCKYIIHLNFFSGGGFYDEGGKETK